MLRTVSFNTEHSSTLWNVPCNKVSPKNREEAARELDRAHSEARVATALHQLHQAPTLEARLLEEEAAAFVSVEPTVAPKEN